MGATLNDLVISAREGDKNAFSELYTLVYRDLYRVAYYAVRNAQDAEDIVSDTVVDAYVGMGRLRDEAAFKAWIFHILSVKCKRLFKKYVLFRIEHGADQELDNLADSLQEETEADQIDVRAEFKKLSDEERLIVAMSIIGGYNSKEVGHILGTNPSTIRTKLSRALAKLRNRLEQGG